jgi:hypothetical protein
MRLRDIFYLDESGNLFDMARINPDLKILRSQYLAIDMPPLTKVVNRKNVIFRGEEPKMLES